MEEDIWGQSARILLICTKLYILADRLQINNLKYFTVDVYKEHLEEGWESTEFIDSLALLHENTMPDDVYLRELAMDFAGLKATELLAMPKFVELCDKVPSIGYTIMRSAVLSKGQKKNKKKDKISDRLR